MRKVGIMSMQRIANYGSFLQAYALKQLIEEVGCNVEFVDYHVGAPVIAENADSKNKVVRKIEKGLETFRYRAPLAHKLSFIRYKQSFARKYMPLLGIADEMNYNPTVDCLVIGSDEVFNCIQKIPMWAIRQNCLEKITMRRNLSLMQRLSVIPHWKSWKSIKRPMKSELC